MDDLIARAAQEQDRHRGQRMKAGLGLLLLLTVSSAVSAQNAPSAKTTSSAQSSGGRTIGLAMTNFVYDFYQTDDAKEECPSGLQASEVDQYIAMPDAKEHLAKFGGVLYNRGPNGEMAAYSPMAITDVLPFKEMASKKGIGLNLDGTDDGRATAKTCKHEKLVGAQGEHIDNQMARAMGCIEGFRKTGSSQMRYSADVETSVYNRILVEITGVDDEKNDPDVQVNFSKSRDRILRDSTGNFLPNMTHRVDTLFPRFFATGHGKIVNGVLITEPISLVRQPLMMLQIIGERQIRDMRLRLDLNPSGATGLMSGYEPVEVWWNMTSKSPYARLSKYSASALYKAAVRYADGFPDPATGKCTAISMAARVNFTRARILNNGTKPVVTLAAKN